MFISTQEKKATTANDIFEALDLGEKNVRFFIELCEEVPPEELVKLRDNRPGFEGKTLLHIASYYGVLSAVLYLLRVGHPVDIQDCSLSKVTPLMSAVESFHPEIAVILLENGASLSKHDINNENALHYAARQGSTKQIKWLIKASGLSKDKIIDVASATNIKLKFPEDLAANKDARDALVGFRTNGHHISLYKGAVVASQMATISETEDNALTQNEISTQE